MSLLRPEALFGRGNASAPADAADGSFAQMVESTAVDPVRSTQADPATRAPKPDRSADAAVETASEPAGRSERSRPLRGADRTEDPRAADAGRSRDGSPADDDIAAETNTPASRFKPRPKDAATTTADDTGAATSQSGETATTEDGTTTAAADATVAVQAAIVPPPVVPQPPTTAPVLGLEAAAAGDPTATPEIAAATAGGPDTGNAAAATAADAATSAATAGAGTPAGTAAADGEAAASVAAAAETATGSDGTKTSHAGGADTRTDAAATPVSGDGETVSSDEPAAATTTAQTTAAQPERPAAAPPTTVTPPAHEQRMLPAAGRGQTDLDTVTGLAAPAAGHLPTPTMWNVERPQGTADAAGAVPIAGLAIEIAARAKDGSNRFEIRLDPPELGRIDVRLHVDKDGQVTSHLVVERAETLDLLKRDAPQLERALQQAGLKTSDGGLEFSLRDQSFAGRDQGWRDDGGHRARVVVPDDELAPAEATRTPYGRLLGASGGVDIRV